MIQILKKGISGIFKKKKKKISEFFRGLTWRISRVKMKFVQY